MKRILIAALTVGAAISAFAQDHSPPYPLDMKLVSQNKFVEVFHVSIQPHGKTPMHDVSARVVVWLRDAHFIDRYADGTIREERRKAGEAEWVSARRHAGENLSDEPMEFIAVVIAAAR